MSMGEEKIREFSDLDAWKKSHEAVLYIYKITKKFPKNEIFGFTNQMRRAGISAESNIAEGFRRNTAKDKQHFFAISKGSLIELQSQAITAPDLLYISGRIHRASLYFTQRNTTLFWSHTKRARPLICNILYTHTLYSIRSSPFYA